MTTQPTDPVSDAELFTWVCEHLRDRAAALTRFADDNTLFHATNTTLRADAQRCLNAAHRLEQLLKTGGEPAP